MVQAVEIPLSWANNIPGVSGISNVEFDIPQEADITAPILSDLPSINDIEEIVDEVTIDFSSVQTAVSVNTPDVGQIVTAIDEEVADPVVEIGEDVEEVVTEAAEGAVEGIDQIIIDSILEFLEDVEEDITGLVADVNALPDRLADRIDEEDPGQPRVSFESVFGALRGDIVEGFEESLQGFLDQPLEGVPDIDDIQKTVEEAVLSVGPAVNDVPFFTAPVEFVAEVITDGIDLVTDDDSTSRLSNSAERLRDDDRL